MKKKSLIISLFIFCVLVIQVDDTNAGYIHSIQIGSDENKETFQYIGDDTVSNKDYEGDDYYTKCLYDDNYKDDKECKKLKKEIKEQQEKNNYTQPIYTYYSGNYYPHNYGYATKTQYSRLNIENYKKEKEKEKESEMTKKKIEQQNIESQQKNEIKEPIYKKNKETKKLLNSISPIKKEKPNEKIEKRPNIRY